MYLQAMAARHGRSITNTEIGITIKDPNIDCATVVLSDKDAIDIYAFLQSLPGRKPEGLSAAESVNGLLI